MELMSPIDSIFLLGEANTRPMHFATLELFEPPRDAGPDFVTRLHRKLLDDTEIHRTFRRHPVHAFLADKVGWVTAAEIELAYHVRRRTLSGPGDNYELLELVSDLQSVLLDRSRPLWRMYLIDGLDDGRFAVYTKWHHAAFDGISAQRSITRTLSPDPACPDVHGWWHPRDERRGKTASAGRTSASLRQKLSAALQFAPSLTAVVAEALWKNTTPLPFSAPHTMFNVPVHGARQCAARSWPLARMTPIRQATGCTVNDILVAMIGGALHHYLIGRDALPDRPLIAMVPISLRDRKGTDTGGNRVAAALCGIGTDVADPAERLAGIAASMRRAKELHSALTATQSMTFSALMLSPLALTVLPISAPAVSTAPVNIVISNVPGPARALYWEGAKLAANYPMSIVLDGLALNFTISSNIDAIDFGIVACRDSVPDLDLIVDYLEKSLAELESATAVGSVTAPRS
ncbi:WS/DGAT/MGAT family acyltransferase [Nocardia tenerifensis]|uniref:Diacylglycerol O-acyltransferase n=1 Tax=Nocardia tenerifensis TaxID=228006 RepID=A0A318KDV1_9NOCA|nr:wax ester/triacylglycerol synthase family O-acyltransferase [Nocardia tenerifensis]PXX69249.1 WS/DGAT/MGAT family acyltransferase [Nocardia tenerifensis]